MEWGFTLPYPAIFLWQPSPEPNFYYSVDGYPGSSRSWELELLSPDLVSIYI